MPRPLHRDITFSIDGREVTAPENTILVDAAKYGDVEIPVFCYEPKRHFEKPLSLSPLVAIDRERCILCYRCVRFSQEVAEDYQLVFEERGAHTYVGTFNGHPYVAPFSGNIIELCPVGALTSKPYRFRARPWDIEQAGSICTLCPAQCNVSFTVRDDRVLRVLSRDHKEVDDGWLCDKGRFAYQAIHADERITRPLIRDGGV